jgi:hypothetical protein
MVLDPCHHCVWTRLPLNFPINRFSKNMRVLLKGTPDLTFSRLCFFGCCFMQSSSRQHLLAGREENVKNKESSGFPFPPLPPLKEESQMQSDAR